MKQIEVNGIGYNDTVVGKNMHNIRSVIRKVPNTYIEKIPERIKKKYEQTKKTTMIITSNIFFQFGKFYNGSMQNW